MEGTEQNTNGLEQIPNTAEQQESAEDDDNDRPGS